MTPESHSLLKKAWKLACNTYMISLVYHWLYSCHIIDFNTKLCILDRIQKRFCMFSLIRTQCNPKTTFLSFEKVSRSKFFWFCQLPGTLCSLCSLCSHSQVSNMHGHTQSVLCPYLIHKDVKDTCSYWQGQEGEEESKEPGRGVHRCMETLRTEMNVQLWQLLLITEMKTWKRYKREKS